jgi:putative tricarboxylic transport membrane protein
MLLTLNITPGPLLFQQQPDVVWGLIAALFLGNLMLLVMNIPMVGLFVRLLMVPSHILMPAVAMIGFFGIYSISGSVFDLFVMIGFGVIGYLLRKLDVPLVPIILGILLGNQMEDNLRRALQISNGEWSILWGSPLALGLWVAAIAGFVAPLLIGRFLRPPTPASVEADPD